LGCASRGSSGYAPQYGWRLYQLTGFQGFDEFMNLVIDDAEEVAYEKKSGKEEGRRKLGSFGLLSLHMYSN
jgi:hypothetical protein